jgi:hypothetical protein
MLQDPEYYRRYYLENRERLLSHKRKYYSLHRDRVRDKRLQKVYGLSLVQARELLVLQAGKCAVCGRAGVDMSIDHDHMTGKVRGILCDSCNRGLGWFEKHRNSVVVYLGRKEV